MANVKTAKNRKRDLQGLKIQRFCRKYPSTRASTPPGYQLAVADYSYRQYIQRRMLDNAWELTPEQKRQLLNPDAELTPALLMDWLFYNRVPHRNHRFIGPANIITEIPQALREEFHEWSHAKLRDTTIQPNVKLFHSYENRVLSFNFGRYFGFSTDYQLEDRRLAANGFYFLPEYDFAQCNYCSTKLVNGINETILERHKRTCGYFHSPSF